jgi:alpha-amylase
VNKCGDSMIKKDWEYLQSSDHFYYMATKFFSDGAVHAYFNPYDTPYDAFMNYMNVLSDFEIRLQKLFPDTAEQDQIFKLGTQVIEKDMFIEKQAIEIEKLNKKISRMIPDIKPAKTKSLKSSVIKSAKEKTDEVAKGAVKKQPKVSSQGLVIDEVAGKLKTSSKTTKKSTPVKTDKKVKLIKK